MTHAIGRILNISADIRYVALYQRGEVASIARSGVRSASAADSDRFEELVVNPTLLTLVRQRGDIDCGGMDYVLIRYGNFFQLLIPTAGGHLSVAIEPGADPLELQREISALAASLDLYAAPDRRTGAERR